MWDGGLLDSSGVIVTRDAAGGASQHLEQSVGALDTAVAGAARRGAMRGSRLIQAQFQPLTGLAWSK